MRALSDQEIQRRKELEALRSLDIEPYPAEGFETSHSVEAVRNGFTDEEADRWKGIRLAGRLMSRRIMGKASFSEVQDQSGRIQLYFNRDTLCPGEDKTLYNQVYKKLLDIGDIVGVAGYVFRTKTGELSLYVESFKVLAKSLRPLPTVKEQQGQVYNAFDDPEMRYRRRYVDLIVNPKARETFKQRSRLVQTMRDYLLEGGYMEVETPILQPLYGGAAAHPFTTHHRSLDTTLYLRIANELYLKRLIVGGFEGVFEFAKDFRNEGMSRFHNPEFTQMELYVAYKDYHWMMAFVEQMVERIARALHGDTVVAYGEHRVDFKAPWKRYTMFEAIEAFTGYNIQGMDEPALFDLARELGAEVDPSMGKGKLIDEIFGDLVEPRLIQPTFIMDYPVEMSPLAKMHREKEGLVERFEGICVGKEFCNAYSELNDPLDQRRRFEDQLELGRRGDEEAMALDEDFLRALEYGMPPTAGLGVGIDRLTMIMTNSDSIREVIFFPQMRPESPPASEGDTDSASGAAEASNAPSS
jgi:lysyl-tRNA synthetase class 2